MLVQKVRIFVQSTVDVTLDVFRFREKWRVESTRSCVVSERKRSVWARAGRSGRSDTRPRRQREKIDEQMEIESQLNRLISKIKQAPKGVGNRAQTDALMDQS